MIETMRNRASLAVLCFCVLWMAPAAVLADTQTDEVLVARGDHALSLADLDGRMTRFPTHERAQFAHDPSNLARLMDQLLVNRILAAEARELGIDRDEKVQRDLAIAIEEVLAIHRLNRYYEPDQMPDFSQLTRERYLADPGAFATPERLVVEHVLISTGSRSEEEAGELATEVHRQALADEGRGFAELIAQYSEDPGKTDNQGRYVIDEPERFDPDFVAAVNELTLDSPISAPARTQFGFHIIRLLERIPSRTPSFEEIESRLIQEAMQNYRSDLRRDKVSEVRSRYPESGNEDLLRTLPHRYGGRVPMNPPAAVTSED